MKKFKFIQHFPEHHYLIDADAPEITIIRNDGKFGFVMRVTTDLVHDKETEMHDELRRVVCKLNDVPKPTLISMDSQKCAEHEKERKKHLD